jgi:hypothetical protein
MDTSELIAMLTDGLTAEQAAPVIAAIQRDAVKSKVAAVKAEKEYNELVTREAALKTELEGAGEGKLGTRAYKEWYDKNITAVQKLQEDYAKYEAKYGKLDAPTTTTTTTTTPPQAPTKEETERLLDDRFKTQYADRLANALFQSNAIMQKHSLAGRKTMIPFNDLAKTAQDKFQGNMEAAYDEWDKPERDKAAEASTKAEIDRRVAEELQKRQVSTQFPGGADMTPSSLSMRSKADVDKFDKSAMRNDLLQTYLSGEYPTTKQ